MRQEKTFKLTEVSSLKSLSWLNPREFECREPLGHDEFDHIFKLCDAMWLHNGDPKMPHAELTSGKCSNGFVDVLRVLQYPNLCEIMAIQMANVFERALRENHQLQWERGNSNWVIGSDHAGAVLSQRVAARLGARHDFTEKGPDKTQIWKRFEVQPEETVLLVEELVTTTGTLEAVHKGVCCGTPHPVNFFPHAMTLVHRSPQMDFYGFPILFVRHYDIETWENPAVCPLCKAGSKRLRPKQNWAELNGY